MSGRDTGAIQGEIKELLDRVAVERASVLGQFDDMVSLILSIDQAGVVGDSQARDAHCERLLDLSYEVLGDCDPVERLIGLLGYEHPADEDE